MSEYTALVAWIERHREQFDRERYTMEDVAKLAVACGFPYSDVAQWKTSAKFKEAL